MNFKNVTLLAVGISFFTVSNVNAQTSEKSRPTEAETFAKIDLNKDGSLDKAEFVAYAPKRRQQEPVSEEKRAELFKKFDTNKDSLLSLEEFSAIIKEERKAGKRGENKDNS